MKGKHINSVSKKMFVNKPYWACYRFGPRFPAMNNSYDQRLRQLAKQVAKEIGIDQYIREGVYVMLGGPAYETVAELRLLRMLGVDAVGKYNFSCGHKI